MTESMGLYATDFPNLNLLSRGKVRDIYEVNGKLLIVATDRISAFDVVMPNPIADKGKILTAMSLFWFKQTEDLIKNHLLSANPDDYPQECAPYRDVLNKRSMLVKKAKPLPVECIVRGYLSGSGWSDYKKTGMVSGVKLPPGLIESEKLPEPIFTPSTKADQGNHDEAITIGEMANLIGRELTEKVIETSLAIYRRAAAMAEKAGIIIADTKMEFGLTEDGLILIDELLTPDSSRFWPQEEYAPGRPQKSFDKQYLRDYLLTLKWNKKPPAPILPPEIIEKTREKYLEALKRLVPSS